MEILLDTNFIITCAKEKIDFEKIANEIISANLDWIVPQQVLNELGNLKDNKANKKQDREAAQLSFELLQSIKPKIVDLGRNPNVDIGIVNYILDKEITLATLDKGLKDRLKDKKILTISNKNYLKLIE